MSIDAELFKAVNGLACISLVLGSISRSTLMPYFGHKMAQKTRKLTHISSGTLNAVSQLLICEVFACALSP
jgi:hypothetical protein